MRRKHQVRLPRNDWKSLLNILAAAETKEFQDEHVEFGDEIAAIRENIRKQVDT